MTLRRIAHPDLDAHLRWQADALRSFERSDGVGPTGWGETRGRLGPGTVTSTGFGSGVPGWGAGPGGLAGGWAGSMVSCHTGIDWEAAVMVTSGAPSQMPDWLCFQNGRSVAVTDDGTAYVVISDERGISLFRRTLAGFTRVLRLDPPEAGLSPTYPTITARGSRVAVAWGSEQWFTATSEILALTFDHPFVGRPSLQRVSNGSSRTVGGMLVSERNAAPSLAFDADMNLLIAWHGRLSGRTVDDAIVATLREGTGSWSYAVPSHSPALLADPNAPNPSTQSAHWAAVGSAGAGTWVAYNYSGGSGPRSVYGAPLDSGLPLAAGAEVLLGGKPDGSALSVYDTSIAIGPIEGFVTWHGSPAGGGPPLAWANRLSVGSGWAGPISLPKAATAPWRARFVTVGAHPTVTGQVFAAWEIRPNIDPPPFGWLEAAVYGTRTKSWTNIGNPAPGLEPGVPVGLGYGYPSACAGPDESVHLTWVEVPALDEVAIRVSPSPFGALWYRRGRFR